MKTLNNQLNKQEKKLYMGKLMWSEIDVDTEILLLVSYVNGSMAIHYVNKREIERLFLPVLYDEIKQKDILVEILANLNEQNCLCNIEIEGVYNMYTPAQGY